MQYSPKLGDVDANLRVARQMTFEAFAKGARVVVLPELCLSGYVMESKRDAADCAQTRDGYQTKSFVDLASKFNGHVVFGYVETSHGDLYNSAAVVGPRGLEGNCQKHNLWGSDNVWATPAESLCPVVVTEAGRLGVLICRDVMNNYRDTYRFHRKDERFYRRGSVDTIALLNNWGHDYGYPDSNWVELAEEVGSNVIVSNRIGKEKDMTFKGGCCVVDRDRRIHTYGSSFTEAAVVGGVVLV